MHKGRLKWWVQRVLPLVYDDSLSYYELLAKVIDKVNELISIVDDVEGDIKEEVTEIMNQWLEDGTLDVVIQQAISDLDARIQTLESGLATTNSNLTALQAKEKYLDPRRLRGQRCVFFGDSWSVGGSAGAIENRFTTQICNILGMIEENFAVGGASFTYNPNNLIMSQVTTATGAMTAAVRATVPLVVLVAGVNDLDHMDHTDFNTFVNTCSNVCDAIHNAFPNALIVAGLCNTRVSGLTFNQYNWITGAQERVVYHKDYPVLVLKNIYNYVRGRATWYVDDGLHLSVVGHGAFANHIAQAICGGSDHEFDFIGPVTFDSSKIALDAGAEAPRIYKLDEVYILTGFHFSTVGGNFSQNTEIGSIPETCAAVVGANQCFPIFTANHVSGAFAIYTNRLFMNPQPGTEISGGFVSDCVYLSH